MEKLTELRVDIWTHSRMPDRQLQRTINAIATALKTRPEHDDETGLVDFKIYEV